MIFNNMNIKFLKVFLILLLSLIFTNSAAWALTNENDLISFEELPDFNVPSKNGAFSYRFIITNKTNERITVKVELASEKNGYSHDSANLSVSKKIELEPKGRREDFIFFPLSGFTIGDIAVRLFVNDKFISKINAGYAGLSYYRSKDAKYVLLDKEIMISDADKIFMKSKSHSYSDFDTTTYASNLDSMDTNWVAYTRFVALMFYDYTLQKMTSATQNAILGYVRAGGTLIIIGEDYKKDFIDSLNYISGKANVFIKKKLDFGKIIICKKDFFDCLQKPENDENKPEKNIRYNSRKDEAGWKTDKNAPKWSNIRSDNDFDKQNTKVLLDGKDVLLEFDIDTHPFGELEANPQCSNHAYNALSSFLNTQTMPLIITILVILISLVLGPVNSWVLWRKNKKILVYVTVPVIAFLFCFGILIYYWIFEANKLNIYRNSFTYLNEEDNMAVTYGAISIYSGKNRNNSLTFPLMSVIENSDKYSYGDHSNRTIVQDNMLALADNWILGRIPCSLSGVFTSRTRSRIEIQRKSYSELEVLNGLGADIYKIYICMPDGTAGFIGENIDAGSVKKCIFSPKIKNTLFAKGDISSRELEIHLKNKPGESVFNPKNLNPGQYVAFLKSDPFLSQKIDKESVMNELGCVVVGKVGNGATK